MTLDEIRVWSVARSQAEITQTMYQELTGSESDLLHYWACNEGQGQTAADLSESDTLVLGIEPSVDQHDPAWVVADWNATVSLKKQQWATINALFRYEGKP